ncbi:MAG: DNA-binding protein [Selenomonadaceae bacterium]|nr:DNA-binding protein [Selenomonadaceae bacterium]
MMNYGKDTDELLAELKATSDVENYLSSNQNEFAVPLHEYLQNLLDEKHLNKSEIIKQSGLNREYAYHIIEGNRKNPSRPKVLAIGVAMGLNLDEMQYLLKYAKQNPLYPRDPWDSVLIFAIEQRLNVLETNELLDQAGETLLLE